MSDSLQPHGLQHTRLPCPPPAPGAYSNSCPSSQRCHPTISSSVVPFSSCLQSFPASESFSRVNSSLIVLAFALWIPYRKQFRMSWWIQQIIKSHWSCEKSHFTLLKIVCFRREQVIFRPLKVHASICQSEDDNSVMGIFQTTVGLTKCTKQQPEWAFQNRPPLTLK